MRKNELQSLGGVPLGARYPRGRTQFHFHETLWTYPERMKVPRVGNHGWRGLLAIGFLVRLLTWRDTFRSTDGFLPIMGE